MFGFFFGFFFVIVLLYATHLPRFVKTQDIHQGLCFLLHRWAAKLNSQSSCKIHIYTLHGWEHPLIFLLYFFLTIWSSSAWEVGHTLRGAAVFLINRFIRFFFSSSKKKSCLPRNDVVLTFGKKISLQLRQKYNKKAAVHHSFYVTLADY